MKRVMVFLLAVTISLALAIPIAAQTAGKPQITFWMKKHLTDAANQVVVDIVNNFMKEKKVDVTMEVMAYGDFIPKWAAAIESGQTPDVSYISQMEVGSFAEKGVLLDLTQLYSDIQRFNGSFYSSLIPPSSFKGKQYAIPFWTESSPLYYRKDLLAAAGFNAPPDNWDEFRKVAKAVTNTEKGIFGAGMGCGQKSNDSEFFIRSVLWSYGGSEVGKDGKTVTINSPGAIQAMRYLYDLYVTDKSTPPDVAAWDDAGNNTSYLSGQSAMIINAGSVLNVAKKDKPDLYTNTGIAQPPRGPQGRFIPGAVNLLTVFKKAKNPNWGKELIAYLVNRDVIRLSNQAAVPLCTPIYPSLEGDALWKDPYYRPFMLCVQDYTFLGYPGEMTPKAGQAFTSRFLNEAVQRMVVDKWTPEQAVAELQKKLTQFYAK